jgi:hypothetical protein
MHVKRSRILNLFRGRRIVIPLVAVVAILFLGLGGYKGIMSFAMDEMTGFLVGTGGHADEGLLAQADIPKAEPAGKGEATQKALPTEASTLEARAVKPSPVVAGSQPDRALAQAAPQGTLERERPPAMEPAQADSTAMRKIMKVYTASFLRDPFYSLVQAGKDRPTKLMDVGRGKMVGSVWGESGIIALLEDDTGRSFALKVGDRVLNGRVISVTPASITFSITVFGLTKTVTLELAEEGE